MADNVSHPRWLEFFPRDVELNALPALETLARGIIFTNTTIMYETIDKGMAGNAG